MASYDWLIGIGIVFGFGLLLTIFTFRNLESFFAFAMIIDAFVVYAGLLDTWTLIILVVVVALLYLNHMKQNKIG